MIEVLTQSAIVLIPLFQANIPGSLILLGMVLALALFRRK